MIAPVPLDELFWHLKLEMTEKVRGNRKFILTSLQRNLWLTIACVIVLQRLCSSLYYAGLSKNSSTLETIE